MNRIAERTIRTIAEQTGIAPQFIEDGHSLHGDLQCDSLDCVECMMALEEEFGIEIDEEEFEKLDTVQQVIDYVTGVCTAARQTPVTTESATMKALIVTEDFLRGFEDDDSQEGITQHLAQIRASIREQHQINANFNELVQAALAVFCEADALKNNAAPLSQEEMHRITQMVERGHDALEALGVEYHTDKPDAPLTIPAFLRNQNNLGAEVAA
jgi:acyl carrier protein